MKTLRFEVGLRIHLKVKMHNGQIYHFFYDLFTKESLANRTGKSDSPALIKNRTTDIFIPQIKPENFSSVFKVKIS